MQGHERRIEIARGQHPFAVLIGCSDSRVPPELLFGRGLGELFTIRVAGNTVDPAAQGSIEYAVAEFGVPLVLAVRENVRRVVARLRGSGAILPELVEAVRLKVAGARYDLDEGAVDFFED
jgi:carbonic anhydrase